MRVAAERTVLSLRMIVKSAPKAYILRIVFPWIQSSEILAPAAQGVADYPPPWMVHKVGVPHQSAQNNRSSADSPTVMLLAQWGEVKLERRVRARLAPLMAFLERILSAYCSL